MRSDRERGRTGGREIDTSVVELIARYTHDEECDKINTRGPTICVCALTLTLTCAHIASSFPSRFASAYDDRIITTESYSRQGKIHRFVELSPWKFARSDTDRIVRRRI